MKKLIFIICIFLCGCNQSYQLPVNHYYEVTLYSHGQKIETYKTNQINRIDSTIYTFKSEKSNMIQLSLSEHDTLIIKEKINIESEK